MERKNLKFSKELSKVMSVCMDSFKKEEPKKRELTLERVILGIFDLLETGCPGALDEYTKMHYKVSGLSDKKTYDKFKKQLIKLFDEAEKKNLPDSDLVAYLPDFSDESCFSTIVSADLKDAIDRAKKTTEIFKFDEITVSLFFLESLYCVSNKMIKWLQDKYSFDREKLAIHVFAEYSSIGMGISMGKIFNGTSADEAKLKEKIITPATDMDEILKKMSPENKKDNDDNETGKNSNDDFQKAGQKGSVSSKAIDPKSKTPFLDEFAFDMTKAAAEGKYDPVIGRTRELGSLIEILACRKKNNAILLGEPGCGKTSVVEALVEKIAKKEVPYELRNKRVVSLDLNALVAGAIYRGEYEKRLQGIIKEVVECKDIIVFIDEVHNLIGNGSSSGQGDGANILKPYLARGEFQLIGATTKMEYRAIEKDGALKRRFQNVVIEDPTVPETIEILKTIEDVYSTHHKVNYTPEVLKVCATWSDKYISDRHQPDKSVDLLDMSGALAKLKITHEEEIKKEQELEKKILEVIQEKIDLVDNLEMEAAKECRERELKLRSELRALKESTYNPDRSTWPTVTLDDVAEVLSKITNIPVDKIKSTDTAKIKELKETLLTNIIGQDEAIEKVVKTLQLGILGIRDPKRPLCSFLLCGPSGTGKTYLAKLLAKYYYGNENAIVKINMGEMDEHSKSRLLGSQPGTIGYDEPTPFDELATRPASVVLLDEVEKADAKIFDVILNAIGEEGYITLNNGKDISFRQSIVILTSNIGTKELAAKGKGLGFEKETGDVKKKSDSTVVMKAIKKFFRPEFLNRLTGISVFNELGEPEMMKIFDLELAKMNERIKESGHVIEIGDDVKEKIVKEVDTKFGARDLTRKLMELVSNDICEEMINSGKKVKEKIIVNLDKKNNIKIKFK